MPLVIIYGLMPIIILSQREVGIMSLLQVMGDYYLEVQLFMLMAQRKQWVSPMVAEGKQRIPVNGRSVVVFIATPATLTAR
jgi:hypothetical protein